MGTLWGLIKSLESIVGKANVLASPEELAVYECDACVLIKTQPDVVVLPASTEEVAQIIKACNKAHVPFVARGAGTGLSGGALTTEGGVLIGLARMNRILSIDTENKTAHVQPGVVNVWLNDATCSHGLFYAPDPSSQAACTLGGNIAENAGGIHCVKYGVTLDHTLGLTVVTPEGDVVKTGGAHGQHLGPSWTGLLVGSEGTLGIVTEAVVRLVPVPQAIRVYQAAFARMEDAAEVVSSIMADGLTPSALELIDAFTAKTVNAAFHIGLPEDVDAVLLIELDGDHISVEQAGSRLITLLNRFSVSQIRMAEDETERLALWKARKGAVSAYGRILPAFYIHDCVVPRSQLAPLLRQIETIGQKYDVLIGNVFHAGDGNLHPNILLDPNDADMVGRVMAAGKEILEACLAVGGVLSGEHGIGVEKAEFMPLQFTEEELAVMQRLKTVFDPQQLANPGKIFPTPQRCGETRAGLSLATLQAGGLWV